MFTSLGTPKRQQLHMEVIVFNTKTLQPCVLLGYQFMRNRCGDNLVVKPELTLTITSFLMLLRHINLEQRLLSLTSGKMRRVFVWDMFVRGASVFNQLQRTVEGRSEIYQIGDTELGGFVDKDMFYFIHDINDEDWSFAVSLPV